MKNYLEMLKNLLSCIVSILAIVNSIGAGCTNWTSILNVVVIVLICVVGYSVACSVHYYCSSIVVAKGGYYGVGKKNVIEKKRIKNKKKKSKKRKLK